MQCAGTAGAARARPVKRWPAFKRWARRVNLVNWLLGVTFGIVFYLMLSLAVSDQRNTVRRSTRGRGASG